MYWLSEANNVYEALYKFYGGRQLPTGTNDVFFGFPGCTKTVCLVTINAMRDNWGLGWFTDNKTQRDAAFSEIAAGVWMDSKFNADINGIIKFENWVYVAAKSSSAMQGYFAGGDYGDLTNIATAARDAINSIVSTGKDIVTSVLTVPGDSVNLVTKLTPFLKWAAILWGVSKVVKVLKKA